MMPADKAQDMFCSKWIQHMRIGIKTNSHILVWEVAAEAERREKRDKLAAQGGRIRQSIEERQASADRLRSQ